MAAAHRLPPQCWLFTRIPLASFLCRLFLRKLRSELRIPVLALVDSDPYGLKILSVYMKVWNATCCQELHSGVL